MVGPWYGSLLSLNLMCRVSSLDSHGHTVKPRFTRPVGGKELGPVYREALYIRVHFTLIYTQSLFSGDRLGPGKSRDPVNRGTVNWGSTVLCFVERLNMCWGKWRAFRWTFSCLLKLYAVFHLELLRKFINFGAFLISQSYNEFLILFSESARLIT